MSNLDSLLTEARARAKGLLAAPSPVIRPDTFAEQIDDARAAIRRRLDLSTTVIPSGNPEDSREWSVKRVIDGDTIDVDGIGPVRLTGFNAPETVKPNSPVEPRGPESSQLATFMLSGKKVRITPQAGDERDIYGRLLATVTLPDGRVANTELSTALGRYTSTPSAGPIRGARAARSAIGSALNAGIMRGLIYPISGLVPDLYENLTQEMQGAQQAIHTFMQQPQVFEAMGSPSQTAQDMLAGTPAIVGGFIGGLAPGMGLYKAATTTFRVAKGLTVAERTVRQLAAASSTGIGFVAAAKMEDGESRFAVAARSALLAGAGEALFLPLMRSAWRAELGESVSKKAIDQLSLKTGMSTSEAERKLTATRTGAIINDFETAKEVIDLAKDVPEMRGSPVHVQAARALEMLDRVLPEGNVSIDPAVETNLAFTLNVNGQMVPVRFPKGMEQGAITNQITELRNYIVQQGATGRTVRIQEPVASNVRYWELFKNRFIGREIKKTPPGKPLGTAPPGSVAETGKIPDVGATVNVVQNDGQRVRATVLPSDGAPSLRDIVSTDVPIREGQRPTSTVRPETLQRLSDASLSDAEIKQTSERDLHVAATLATPGKPIRQSRIARRLRASVESGDPVFTSPSDASAMVHFTPAEAGRNGVDFETYVTALTDHVMAGESLTEAQSIRFPYLRRLQERVASMAPDGQDVVPDLTSGRTTPVEGEVFHDEGGLTAETKIRLAKEARAKKRLMHEGEVTNITSRLATETDPAVRATLEKSLRNAQADLQSVAEPVETPAPTGKVKKTPQDHIWVSGPSGKPELLHVSQVFVDVPMKAGEKLERKTLVAHPDGGDRHGMVDLDSGEVHLEPVGANTDPAAASYFRSDLFTSVDPTKEWGRQIPFFVHADGSATMSVTPVSEYFTPKQASFGHVADFGPVDRIQAARDKQSYGVRRTGEEILGLTSPEPPSFGRFPSSYTPRAIRGTIEGDVRRRPDVRIPSADRATTDSLGPGTGWTEADFLSEEEGPTMRIRARGRNTRGLPVEPSDLRGMRIERGKPLKRLPQEAPAEYGLTADMLSGENPHPEWATVRKTARALQKAGYDPGTPLRIRIAREVHKGSQDIPSSLTIGDAAALELPMPNSDRLYEEAAARGLTVMPRGAGSELIMPDGTKRIFKDDLEALEAVGRIPISKVDRSIDQPLAALWNMGVENGLDPEIDAARFIPASLQEMTLGQIIKGGKPLTEVRTSDISAFNSAFEVLTQNLPKNRRLVVQTLEETSQSTRLAIFDPTLVQARATALGESLNRLGISPNVDPRLMVQDLDRLPHGLHIMKADDPESSIMYSWFRQHSMKGNWEEGNVAVDATGPHRRYTDEQKSKFSFRVCP
jgi:hypothetical protein